jgi:hypothetical protein
MVTFCFVYNKPANVEFVWDDVGPGLHVTWCEDSSLIGFVVRSDSGLKAPGMFQTLCESLVR